MFTYSEQILKIVCAQLTKCVGFKSINQLALEILIDLLSRYILDFGRRSASFANQCNRTQVNFDDIFFVLKQLGLNLDELVNYLNLEHVKIPFAGPLLPSYPVVSKEPIRIQFPTKSECEKRASFYQDWQPTLNSNHYLSKLEPEEQQQIEERLEQLDLIDYIEHRKLKITEDSSLNKKLLSKIRSKVDELNIGGFTELEAQVPLYIYLSEDGKPQSFGNKLGRLPEARKHNTVEESSISGSKSKKKSSKSSKKSKSDKKKNKSKHRREHHSRTSLLVDNCEEVARSDQLKQQKKQSKRSEETAVSELMNEMISNISEDKLNQSFYDENEAAKTLVLLSYDSSKSVLSTAESPSIEDGEENQIDYPLTKFNYDLNNNHSGISDLNNNTIYSQRKENGYSGFSNLINGKLEKSFANDYQHKLNDVKNLTIEDDCSNQISNNNSPKFKFKLNCTFGKYKESLGNHSESINNHNNHRNHSTPSSKSSKIKTETPTDHSPSPTPQASTTKDKAQQKRKNKKSNSVESTISKKSDSVDRSSSVNKSKSKKNKSSKADLYYCPTCKEPDDGTPMIGCDQCLEWFHWKCQNIFVTPNEEEKWFCLQCSIQQSLDESKQLKKAKKKMMKEEAASEKALNGKKRSKHEQKQEDKKARKKSNKNEETYYCPSCSKPDNGTAMIGCDRCDSWFHYPCVGIKSEPEEDESWYCSDCKKKKKHKKLKKQ